MRMDHEKASEFLLRPGSRRCPIRHETEATLQEFIRSMRRGGNGNLNQWNVRLIPEAPR